MLGKTLLLVSALALTSACSTTTPDTAADEAKIRAELPLWWDHYNKGDAEGVANLYASDAVLLSPGAPSYSGREAIRNYLTSDIAATRAAGMTMQGGEVTGLGVSGDLAWASGTFSVSDSAGTVVDSGKYVSVFRREQGEWKLIRDIWNSDKAPSPAG